MILLFDDNRIYGTPTAGFRVTDVTADTVVADVQMENGGPFAFSTVFFAPTRRHMHNLQSAGRHLGTHRQAAVFHPYRRFLSYGPALTIVGPENRRTVSPASSNRYTWLGEATTGAVTIQPTNGPFLNPGSFTITSAAGPDVASFQANVTMPAALTWTNRDQLATVDRSQPLTVTWTGAPGNAPVVIRGGGVDNPRLSRRSIRRPTPLCGPLMSEKIRRACS